MQPDASREVLRHAEFRQFWLATGVSELGRYVTTLALQILVVLQLYGTPTHIGLVNAARWLPYLLLGLMAGAAGSHGRCGHGAPSA